MSFHGIAKICLCALFIATERNVDGFVEIGEISQILDEITIDDENIDRWPRTMDKRLQAWHISDMGNECFEELSITNIEVWEYENANENVNENVHNWQFLERDSEKYFGGCQGSIFYLYYFDPRDRSTDLKANISVLEPISTFKIFSSATSNDDLKINVVISVVVENKKSYSKWYIFKNNELILLSTWEFQKIVKELEYFNFNFQDKLLLLFESDTTHNETNSQVEICDVKVEENFPKLSSCRQFLIAETSAVQLCPSRGESIIISFLSKNHVLLYEYTDESMKLVFPQVRNITTLEANDVLCFESGNFHYLVTLGSVPNLFKFNWNKFAPDEKIKNMFNEIGNITYVQYLPVDTYRNEVILFVQLKNSSILALTWQDTGFKNIPLSNEVLSKLNKMNLARASVIPNYGFIEGNLLVKVSVELKQNYWPDRMKELSDYKAKLEDILKKQEKAVLAIESIVNKNIKQFAQEKDLNFREIDVEHLIFNKSNDFPIFLRSENVTFAEIKSDLKNILDTIEKLESRISEVEIQKSQVPRNISNVYFNEINILGDLNIEGNLTVENLKIRRLNNINMETLENECLSGDKATITGTKSFPTINFAEDNLKIKRLNGIPLKDISFDSMDRSYEHINISRITKLEVQNSLNFSIINGVNWKDLMTNLVLKNERKTIPGVTIITENLKSSFLKVDNLNGLKYPSDYVVISDPKIANVVGVKTFDSLTVYEFSDVQEINGIDADDFITLNSNQTLEHQITFENLIIDERLQVDGHIIGIPELDIDTDLNLLNSNLVQSCVMLKTLTVNGNIFVENSLNSTKWSELDTIILEDQKSAVITGVKTFLGEVHIRKNLEIKNRAINGHHVRDFVTLDTRQIFHNVAEMSGNIAFDNVSHEELQILEERINSDIDRDGKPRCLKKQIIFTESLVVDEFSSRYVNTNISGSTFFDKMEFLLKDVYFENLHTDKLIVDNLEARIFNKIDLHGNRNEIMSESGLQTLSGDVTIRNLKTAKLSAHLINNRTPRDIKRRSKTLNLLYEEVLRGERVVDALNVTGSVIVSNINGESFCESISLANASVKNLEVRGLFNKLNITKRMLDTVLKNEDPVVITGSKKIKRMKANKLEVQFINKHLAEDVVSATKDQTLSGPVKIIGSAYVKESLDSFKKLNGLHPDNVDGKISDLGNGVIKLKGNFLVNEESYIRNLTINGYLQNKDANVFLQNLVYLDEENVTIFGTKTFKNSVDFSHSIKILKSMNEIDVERFYNNAVFIDHPFRINSKVVFESDILVDGDLTVTENLKAGSLNKIDLDNLMENALYINRPTSLIETLTLSNVIFESNIAVDSWNNVKMNKLFTLHDDSITHYTLHCVDALVLDIEINGLVNGENLKEMYENTFTLSTDQIITGEVHLSNNVDVKGNLNAKRINNVDISKTISLDDEEPMYGNFIFNDTTIMVNDLDLTGNINGIDINEWKSNIVNDTSPWNIITGKWIIHGNVYFNRNAYGTGSINGQKLQDLADKLKQQRKEMKNIVGESMKNMKEICKHLQVLKEETEKITYKFKAFEYLRVLPFDLEIASIHHFEYEAVDYLAVNFETCHLDLFAYTSEGFKLATNFSNFGRVRDYLTLNHGQELFLVTVGRPDCGRSAGNLWSFKDGHFEHILDLGNVSDATKLNDSVFAVAVDYEVREWSLPSIVKTNSSQPFNVIPITDKKVRFFKNQNDTLLISHGSIYELRPSNLKFEEFENPFGTNNIINFQAGVFRREYILSNKNQDSENHIFIYNNNLSKLKLLQSNIELYKVGSIVILNFDDFFENLLIFSENNREIKIYQYKGIENFKFHSHIKFKHQKLYSFKLRMHSYFAKKHCLGIIRDNTLTILEAKTYGEKLDRNGRLMCSIH